MNLTTTPWDDYELIDTGNGRKLERFGEFILDRPSPQALWKPARNRDEWTAAHAIYHRSAGGGGKWEMIRALPESWTIRYGERLFIIKPTGFGHLGVFVEQTACWDWITRRVESLASPASVLNLFAYSGGSTLAAASAGAQVCHVDGSRGAVTWARQNVDLNALTDAPIRWIVDDVTKFVNREARRKRIYQGVILDPPSFGRGPKGQVWKIEQDLAPLLDAIDRILDPDHRFLLLTSHSRNISPVCLHHLLSPLAAPHDLTVESGEIIIGHHGGGWGLPAGFFARIS